VIPLPYQVLTYVNGLVGVDFLQQLKKLNIHFDTNEIEAMLWSCPESFFERKWRKNHKYTQIVNELFIN
jgi:hypothetical protein